MRWVSAGAVSGVGHGRTKAVRVGGLRLVLANWRGKVYALGGLCAHRGMSLEGAAVWDGLLDCPWHHFQYDVRTGRNVYPKNVYPEGDERLARQLGSLPTYPTRTINGEVFVGLPDEAP
jgi:nitrite reductase/ring-hydroxylating ferredoxin subunit